MAAENLAMGYVMRHGFDGGLRAEGWLAIDSISNIALCVKSAASDSGGEEEESRFWTGGAGFEAEQLRRQGRAKQKHEPAIFAVPSFKILSEIMIHNEIGHCRPDNNKQALRPQSLRASEPQSLTSGSQILVEKRSNIEHKMKRRGQARGRAGLGWREGEGCGGRLKWQRSAFTWRQSLTTQTCATTCPAVSNLEQLLNNSIKWCSSLQQSRPMAPRNPPSIS